MSTWFPALALAALAIPVETPTSDAGLSLTARCRWAERGWRAELLGIDLHTDPAAVESAHGAQREHVRLHGWTAFGGSGHSTWIDSQATCPPAALAALTQRELPPPHDGVYDLYRDFALVLARNGLFETALRYLESARPVSVDRDDPSDVRRSYEAWSLRDRVHVLVAAGEWDRALAAFEEFRPAPGCTDDVAATVEALGLVRARCLLELGRTEELEALTVEHLVRTGVDAPTCAWVEILIEGWKRAGLPRGREHLLQPLRVQGHPVRLIEELWDTAERHDRLLAGERFFDVTHFAELLDEGDHEREVCERIAAAGPGGLAALIRLAKDIPYDDVRAHGLYRVLASTGDPRVLPLLEARLPDRDAFLSGLRLDTWERARGLREDLGGETR